MSNSINKRFVILHHQIPAKPGRESSQHWDLMLEDGSELLTWAIQERPEAGKTIPARQLPNHRLKYLDYEGPISDDRGSVSRFLAGGFVWLERENDRIKVELQDADPFSLIEIDFGAEQYVVCMFS